MRHLLTLFDLSSAEIERIFAITSLLKDELRNENRRPILPGRVMGLLFEKPSLRTRVSFEAAMTHLGGSSHFLGEDVGWGKREVVKDFASVLSQYADVIVYRTHEHQRIVDLARYSSCPVINGLTGEAHPCQALTDLFTLRELCGVRPDHTLAYVGDANNVARSLAVACAKIGVRFAIASPPGYDFNDEFLSALDETSPGGSRLITNDPAEALAGASAVYTDVWASMGQESEKQQRMRDFQPYQVNARLMALAPDDAIFLHCLPAHRGDEVTDEVIDSPQSAVLQQAANRLHVQKAILVWLLDRDEGR